MDTVQEPQTDVDAERTDREESKTTPSQSRSSSIRIVDVVLKEAQQDPNEARRLPPCPHRFPGIPQDPNEDVRRRGCELKAWEFARFLFSPVTASSPSVPAPLPRPSTRSRPPPDLTLRRAHRGLPDHVPAPAAVAIPPSTPTAASPSPAITSAATTELVSRTSCCLFQSQTRSAVRTFEL
ncbi:hypothetical protein B0H11DRAFT_2259920 [Mycena galericulata]|nr:hypothetical protein B0H11DRAFT_2259920 [Mycena galericulata]